MKPDDQPASCPGWCVTCNIVDACFKAGFEETVSVVKKGTHTADAIFDGLAESNYSSTLAFRCLAYVMNVIGHILIWSPFATFIEHIPFIGWLLGPLIWFAVCCFSFIWAALLHFTVMAFAWIFFRPVFGCIILVLIGAAIFLMAEKGKDQKVNGNGKQTI